MLLGGLRYAALGKKALTLGAGCLAIFANLWLLVFLRSDGFDEKWLRTPAAASLQAPLSAPDPSVKGSYAIGTFFYGHGDDLRRREYSAGVAMRTKTVDASAVFADFGGWKAKLRKRYWGFGMDRLPLNARVWYPHGDGVSLCADGAWES